MKTEKTEQSPLNAPWDISECNNEILHNILLLNEADAAQWKQRAIRMMDKGLHLAKVRDPDLSLNAFYIEINSMVAACDYEGLNALLLTPITEEVDSSMAKNIGLLRMSLPHRNKLTQWDKFYWSLHNSLSNKGIDAEKKLVGLPKPQRLVLILDEFHQFHH